MEPGGWAEPGVRGLRPWLASVTPLEAGCVSRPEASHPSSCQMVSPHSSSLQVLEQFSAAVPSPCLRAQAGKESPLHAFHRLPPCPHLKKLSSNSPVSEHPLFSAGTLADIKRECITFSETLENCSRKGKVDV